MALVHEVQTYFNGLVRGRGREYFHRRAVTIDRGDAWSVHATVSGTSTYQVDLVRDPTHQDITTWCTCPFVEHGEPCKHIWATVLAASAQNLLGGDGRQRVTDLYLDRRKLDALVGLPDPASWDRDDEEDDDDDGVSGEGDEDWDDELLFDEESPDGGLTPEARLRGSQGEPQSGSERMRAYWARRAARVRGGATELRAGGGTALRMPRHPAGDRPGRSDAARGSSPSSGSFLSRPVSSTGSATGDRPLPSSSSASTSSAKPSSAAGRPAASASGSSARPPEWQRRLASFLPASTPAQATRLPRAQPREIVYLVDVGLTAYHGSLTLEIGWRDRKASGVWGRYRTKAYVGPDLMGATTVEDERVVGLLTGHDGLAATTHAFAHVPPVLPNHVSLPSPLVDLILPDLCAAGRCRLRREARDEELSLLAWDDGPPWELWLEVRVDEERDACVLDGSLRRGDERMPWDEPLLLLHGHLVTTTHVARFDDRGGIRWIALLATEGAFVVPRSDVEALLGEIAKRPGSPHLDVDDRLGVQIVREAPRRRLSIRPAFNLPSAASASAAAAAALRIERGGMEQATSASAPTAMNTPGDGAGGAASAAGADRLAGARTADVEVDVSGAANLPYAPQMLHGAVTFDYDGVDVPWDAEAERLFVTGERRVVQRDRAAEEEALRELAAVGFRPVDLFGKPLRTVWELRPNKLPAAVRGLSAKGWTIEAEGRRYRTATGTRARVRSGIDWFDLEGIVEFGDVSASIGAVMDALSRGRTVVTLDDGSQGVLPEEWLARQGHWAALGERHGTALRFTRGQIGVIDALLAAAPEIDADAHFAQARASLEAFAGVTAVDAPPEFHGELRAYQRDGLGWIQFLERFGFGGCLADDMGLGKTIQVLAVLAARRTQADPPDPASAPDASGANAGAAGANASRVASSDAISSNATASAPGTAHAGNADAAEGGAGAVTPDGIAGGVAGRVRPPSLVVVPRSLVFNWQREAARFAPSLRLLDHTGADRLRDPAAFTAALQVTDLVITTYGTLRRDAAHLADCEFDYVILDEAHAIKNTDSQTAKAVRLLRGRHRLALTGTPVQNHLGELWSLFEFLNPGMLGRSSAFSRVVSSGGSESEARQALGKLLRPFVLRRTKADVARDLPARVEDTIVCRLSRAERQFYDELRAHYQQSLASRIDRDGWAKSKMHVLEALLRLRQAACHPGLVDRAKRDGSSAKMDVLLSQLRELREEGHKAIVFSQFVRLLDLARTALDREGIRYAYLDGRTKDRETVVEQFQTDPDCPFFLVSLKAGGLGLNLTAAEYVFLLDPWWNPAIEAQAIDRAHRIGQTRKVFAYRLIAENTIEEKVIALQARKRELADAILTDEAGALRTLTREDLELLLS